MITERNMCARSTKRKESAMDHRLGMVAESIYCVNIIEEKGKFRRIYGEELSLRRGMIDKPK